MPIRAEVQRLPDGARFYRADLHIHSFGGSHDVSDAEMTPKRIVEAALTENLQIIAITDHQEIENAAVASEVARGSGLLVIPGVELSTADGHLLCFLPTIDALRALIGRVALADRGKATSRCQTSLLDCLNELERAEGFGVLAHVDAAGGFGEAAHGMSPHRMDILCHPSLLGIEVLKADSPISYTKGDPDGPRSAVGAERGKRLGLGSQQYLARVLNSDAHSLAALGKNRSGARRITRVKMDTPSFAGLVIALRDSDARVRIEDQIPERTPRVLGVQFEGGFLDGQCIHFSRNLNCIIGGRGTGKSTTFEAVRCLQGAPSGSNVVDSEVWPTAISYLWEDQAGQVHHLSRSQGGEVQNEDDPAGGPVAFEVESYGQGEAAHISRAAHENPLALLEYLDRFVETEPDRADEDAARDELLAFQTDIEKAQREVDRIPQHERELATTQQQLSALEQAKAKDVIELQRRLANEQAVRADVVKKLKGIRSALGTFSVKALVEQMAELADPASLAAGGTEFQKIVSGARSLEAAVASSQQSNEKSLAVFEASAEQQVLEWKAKEGEALKSIEEKRKALEAQNIRLDMVYIQKLAKDEARLKAELIQMKAWKPLLLDLHKRRGEASKRRWAARERIGVRRDAFGKAASETLRAALSDLSVTLKFQRSACSPDAEQQVIEAMGWRTNQVPRAALLIQSLTLPGLLAAIDKGDLVGLGSITNRDGVKLFDRIEAGRIVDVLKQPAIRFGLERCAVHDLPKLTVTKEVPGPAGKPQYVQRDFTKLSLGQQQSVLLALMLSSRSTAPLIIDQPEDNLDGQFIYNTLVPVLRRAKERRQVIVVTHNANIAVLGDAEQIVVLRGTNERGIIVSRGSIDDAGTRDAACTILEGAKEAFRRRAQMYGAA